MLPYRRAKSRIEHRVKNVEAVIGNLTLIIEREGKICARNESLGKGEIRKCGVLLELVRARCNGVAQRKYSMFKLQGAGQKRIEAVVAAG